MIGRVLELVQADRALASACIADLTDGIVEETPTWRAASARVIAAEDRLPSWLLEIADHLAGWWNRPAWLMVWDLDEQVNGEAK